jgi:hypothetical protein
MADCLNDIYQDEQWQKSVKVKSNSSLIYLSNYLPLHKAHNSIARPPSFAAFLLKTIPLIIVYQICGQLEKANNGFFCKNKKQKIAKQVVSVGILYSSSGLWGV